MSGSHFKHAITILDSQYDYDYQMCQQKIQCTADRGKQQATFMNS